MAFIFCIFWVSLILYVWFNTSAVLDYGKQLGLSSLMNLEVYEDLLTNGPSWLAYPTFLYQHFPSFITKLVSCPFCLSLFLGLFFSVFTSGPLASAPMISLLGLLLYKVLVKIKLV